MKGIVYYNETRAGTIEQNDDGYRFQYDAAYTADANSKPVSHTLPLQREPYTSKTMFAFFDGLIPEGWLLDLAVETWKIDPADRMTLLLTVCRDCIGAVKIINEA